jgi:undecaprenyl-diphosphatase
MNILHGLILGIVEGLTEFLPISSTAHLVLVGDWLRLPASEFLKTFDISIQLGAILAVVVLYWKKIWSSRDLVFKIGAAFIPTGIVGLLLYKVVKNYLLDNNYIIAGALLSGGVVIIGLERYYAKKNQGAGETAAENLDARNGGVLSYRQAFLIGLFQSLAIIPGVSRAGATIIGGLGLGIKRREIVEFSFLLAIPTMAAASGLDLYKSHAVLSALNASEISVWIVGFVSAFFTALIGVRFFLKFIQTRDFRPFGWYRIILGLGVLAWLWL